MAIRRLGKVALIRGVLTVSTVVASIALGACGSDGGSSDSKKSELIGTWERTVTKADIDRTAKIRHEGRGQEAPSPGLNTLTITSTELRAAEVKTGASSGQTYSANDSGSLELVRYTQPEKGTFCDIQIVQTANYRWRVTGEKLSLAAVEDACADRDSILSGTWARK
jgi:hypothetical protein